MFRLDPAADASGTSYLASVFLPPAFLVAQFGSPAEMDRYKVSGQYRFTDDRGNTFTLYDWKSTSLYFDHADTLPTPAEFWADPEPREFNVGGFREENDDGLNLPATPFRSWRSTAATPRTRSTER